MTAANDPLIEALGASGRTPQCPPPETFLAEEWAALDTATVARIERHVGDCTVCQAERRLAAAFVEPDGRDELAGRRLRKALDRTDIAVELATRSRRGGALPMVATAAVLGIATAILYFVLGQGPAAPPPMRGATLELIAPQSDRSAPVTRFEWQARDGAARYELTVRAPDGNPVLRRESPSSTLSLPGDDMAWQRPGTLYEWQVDAYDAQGERIATSRSARFRVLPPVEDGQ